MEKAARSKGRRVLEAAARRYPPQPRSAHYLSLGSKSSYSRNAISAGPGPSRVIAVHYRLSCFST